VDLLVGLVFDKNKQKQIVSICDPVCGGGTLLLAVKEKYPKSIVYGQDSNSQISRLARMNCIIHGLARWEFAILTTSCFGTIDDFCLYGPYDIIVADPTVYSNTNLDQLDLSLFEQKKFEQLDVSDFGNRLDAFTVLFAMQTLASGGIAAILVYPGLLHKDGACFELRKLLIEQNMVDAVISLPSNVLFHTQLNPQILILRKKRLDKQVLFIDASREYLPVKDLETNKKSILDNLTNEGVAKIHSVYHNRENQPFFSQLVNLDLIKKNNYSLSVANYVSRLA
jgi:Type I restriction-modification system methyltransferase subunit